MEKMEVDQEVELEMDLTNSHLHSLNIVSFNPHLKVRKLSLLAAFRKKSGHFADRYVVARLRPDSQETVMLLRRSTLAPYL